MAYQPPQNPQQGQYQPYPQQPYQQQPYQQQSGPGGGTDGMATGSLVTGIVGLVLFWFPIVGVVLSILATIFGHVGKRRIDRSGGVRGGRGMAIAGLIMGWIGIGLFVLFVILAIAGDGSFEVST